MRRLGFGEALEKKREIEEWLLRTIASRQSQPLPFAHPLCLSLSLSQRSGPARGRPCVCWLGYASPFWTLLDRPIIFIIYYSCYHHLHGINGANNWLIIWAMA